MSASSPQPMAFIDLAAQQNGIRDRIDAAIKRVLDHGSYIMGPEVRQFEQQLSDFCGAKHSISCANGTDALALVLMARDIGPGDAVIVPSFTFAATAEVVAWLGATPIFADVLPETFNLDPDSCRKAAALAKDLGLSLKAIIPVDLFGQPAGYDGIMTVAKDNGVFVLCDAAQSFGASYASQNVGTIGLVTTTSFFPAKPLGCYGDGGAIFTDDDALCETIKSLRVHGQGSDKYDNVRIGMNGRLDTIQAAILIEKLAVFPQEIIARDRVAQKYNDALKEYAKVPCVPAGSTSVWAQYTLRVTAGKRDAIAIALKGEGVPTAIYYPKALHSQTAYRRFPVVGNCLPVSEQLADEVLSLPMHPYLDAATQDRVIAATIKVLQSI